MSPVPSPREVRVRGTESPLSAGARGVIDEIEMAEPTAFPRKPRLNSLSAINNEGENRRETI